MEGNRRGERVVKIVYGKYRLCVHGKGWDIGKG